MWEVEFTDEFAIWWEELTEAAVEAAYEAVEVVRRTGPSLGRPRVDTIKDSKHANLKELRVQVGGEPYRIFFAFDPRRTVILLIGGCKTGDGRFYETMVPVADKLFDEHLAELRKEGLL